MDYATSMIVLSLLCYLIAAILGVTATLRLVIYINENPVYVFLSKPGAEKTWRGKTIYWLRDYMYYDIDSTGTALAFAALIAIIGVLIH